MKENLVTKDQLHVVEDRVITHIDGFIKLHETLDLELAALRGKYERLEGRVIILENRMGIHSV